MSEKQEPAILLDNIDLSFKTSKTTAELFSAMLKAAFEFPEFKKENKSYLAKYVKLENIQKEITPILLKHDLLLIQSPGNLISSIKLIENVQYAIAIMTRIQHKSGEYIESICGMPLPSGKQTNISQEAGIAITYARRYVICAMLNLNIHGDDYDGAKPKEQYQQNPKGNRIPRLSAEEAKSQILEMIQTDQTTHKTLDEIAASDIISRIEGDKPYKGGWLALHEKLKTKFEAEWPVF